LSLFPPFFPWKKCQSKDKDNPDKIKIRIKELETFETEYSICVNVEVWIDDEWKEMAISLKSHESANRSFLDQWTKFVKEGKIKVGDKLVLSTFLDISKNGRKIRRFSLA